MKIGVIGSGSWGTAISILLDQNGHNVKVYSRDKETLERFNRGENPYFLPGIPINKRIKAYDDFECVTNEVEIIVLAVPAQAVREVVKKIKNKKAIIVNLSKGIEIETGKLINQIVSEELGDVKYCCLSGPSHAEEVARNIPTGVVIAGVDEKINKVVQKTFSNVSFRAYTNLDLMGVEICGASKNIYAIAAGTIDGFGNWDNTKAFLITRALVEMSRLGEFYGGTKETFMGLAGAGDMIVTCNSQHSRNRYVGELLGKGKKLKDILNSMNMVAEGVYTCKAVYNLIKKHNIEMPIAEKIYDVMYNEEEPRQAIHDLMSRTLKSEI
jgi:glycerol-3-phosphate dehydrogenase (NAD(P)+)